jgi:hypothetical protein
MKISIRESASLAFFKRLRSTLSSALIITATSISAPAFAEEADSTTSEPNYSAGLTLGSLGLGAMVSGKTEWSLTENDQIQWRVLASGLEGDFGGSDTVEISGIDYKDGDIAIYSFQAGVDWYPISSGWADEIYLSTGLLYQDGDFSGTADNAKSFYVGNTLVNPGDITSLYTEIDNSQVLPYLSVGWGNKISYERGFDLQAEIGFAMPTKDANVSLTAVDPTNHLSAADLATEKKAIEDDVNSISAFATIMVSYHF